MGLVYLGLHRYLEPKRRCDCIANAYNEDKDLINKGNKLRNLNQVSGTIVDDFVLECDLTKNNDVTRGELLPASLDDRGRRIMMAKYVLGIKAKKIRET